MAEKRDDLMLVEHDSDSKAAPETATDRVVPIPSASRPDIFNFCKKSGPPATRTEVLSYYAYFAGNNGIGAYQ